MGDDAEEFPENEHRETPRRRPFSQATQRRESRRVLRRLSTVCVNQNVRIDRDQLRPSIRS